MRDRPDEIFTCDEVAAYLAAGRRTASRHAADCKPLALVLGGTWRFRRGDRDKWTASSTSNAMVDDEAAE